MGRYGLVLEKDIEKNTREFTVKSDTEFYNSLVH